MRRPQLFSVTSVLVLTLGASWPATAGPDEASVELVVKAGRPLRVVLDTQVRVQHVGQRVTATLVEPVYVYDRIVVPAGTRVLGHVAKLVGAARLVRVRAMLNGDFSPARDVVLQFDALVLNDGRTMDIRTIARGGAANVALQVARSDSKSPGLVTRARQAIAQQARDARSAVTGPGKLERLKDLLIRRLPYVSNLPYHPQYLRKGTFYTAELLSPLDFGSATPTQPAPSGTSPAPESILDARLITTIDSSKAKRGTPIGAVVTRPVFSSDHRLILPEGTGLKGEVTFAKPAAHFHHNGQLRFLFETVDPPDQPEGTLLASLHSVAASRDDHVAVDEEGGATITNQKTRFIAPVLAFMALRASADHDRFDRDAAPGTTPPVPSSGIGSRGLGGFFGLGLLGTGLSMISRPIGVGLGVVGLARTLYGSVFGKGRDVAFPADTAIQVQLAPGRTAAK